MKKLILFILTTVMIFSLSACSGSYEPAVTTIGTEDTIVEKDTLKQATVSDKVGYQLEMPEKGEEIAIITMESGAVIKIRFFPEEAPKAVYNFKMLALNGYYDGITFHRVVQNFVIQGGDPTATGMEGISVWGTDFEDEFTPKLLNLDGAVSMANNGVNTNSSQFFISNTNGADINWDDYQAGYEVYKQDPEAFASAYGKWIDMDKVTDEVKSLYNEHGGNIHLDGAYSTNGTGHTVFGQVFEGLDAVADIQTTAVDDNNKPLTDVVIKKVEITVY